MQLYVLRLFSSIGVQKMTKKHIKVHTLWFISSRSPHAPSCRRKYSQGHAARINP